MKKITLILLTIGISTTFLNAQIAEKTEDISPLLIGETIPSVELKTPKGELKTTTSIFAEKPTVVLIYRGGWCPFCNVHLSEIQSVQKDILKLGYQIIAISPDSHENLQATDEKNKLDYSLYSDADGTLIKAMGLAYKAPEKYALMLSEKSGGKNSEGFLPVPSMFVVDATGKILFEYINPDYKVRISANLLLAVLRELQK